VSKHTAGPWSFTGDSLTHRSFNIYQSGSWEGQKHVATVNNLPAELLWKRDADEALANAKLIAAAPEMFEFLCGLSLAASDNTASARVVFGAMTQRARGIIAKVRGRE